MAQLNRINLAGVSQGFVWGTYHERLASEDASLAVKYKYQYILFTHFVDVYILYIWNKHSVLSSKKAQ